ncbi:MAG: TetR/AcrR family transcriptional regulator [Actinobacteria bacterium]|nr:MAG: TetR/AcrR family transcriptional regulator [Actinomycetota bacterium]
MGVEQAAKPGRMSAGERRGQLLDVTKSIVERRGFHAVSIEAVAREAGVSRPIVYGHFKDLPGLLEALVEREGARALAQLATVLPSDLRRGDPRDSLLGALRGYLSAAQADPVTWRLVLMPPEGAPSVLREQIARGRGAVLAQLAEAIRPGFGSGRESPDPELTALMLSTFADEAVRLVLTDPEHYPPERILSHTAWILGELESG